MKASASIRVAAAASGAIYAQMLAGVSKAISLREVAVITRTAVATEIGIVRSFSVGTASAGNVATGLAQRNPRQVDVDGSVEIAWSTGPTGVATGAFSYLRREIVGGAPGFSGAATGMRTVLWSPDDGALAIEPTGATGMGLLFVNVGSAAGAALDFEFTWDFGPSSDV